MPTTSNFGWTTPADTDLVKDGALAIRTLGNGIDTSMAELKGGTTGQILSKTSNTDMDFTWINNDQGDITAVNVTSPITGGGTSGAVTISSQDGTTAQKGAVQLENSTSSTSTTTAAVPASVKSAYDLAAAAIPKNLTTTTGDIIYASAANTPARLAVGSTNQVLTVSGGVPVWATPSGGGDFVKIASSTFTNQSSVTVDSVFDSTYKNYMVILKVESNAGVGQADDLQIQFRYSSTTQTSDYYGSYFQYNRGNTLTTGGFANTAQNTVALNIGDSTSATWATLNFFNVGTGSENAGYYSSGNNISADQAAFVGTGWVNVARLYTGFLIKSSSSNITGSYAVWGLKR